MPQFPSAQVRTAGLALAVGTLVVAFVVTQWPFEYRLTEFAVRAKWNRIDWSWFPRSHGRVLSRDFVLNLLMLIPLGFGFGLWRRAVGVRLAAEALALGIGIALTLEVAQLATRARYTSFPDLWRNAFGCLIGGLMALAFRRVLSLHGPGSVRNRP